MAADNNDILLALGLDKDSVDKFKADLTTAISGSVSSAIASTKSLTSGAGKEADSFFKGFAFNIGLVGYSLENLGRRLEQFSTEIFKFLESSAKVTENLERMRNSLVVEGLPADERQTIEGQLRRISDLPNAKIDTITKGFVELHKAGLGVQETLNLLEGLTKGSASAGSGAVGLVHSITILRDTLSAGKFARGLRSLEGSLGREVIDALEATLGATDAKDLNKIGVNQVVGVISRALSEVNDSLPITIDRIERIHNRFTIIRADLEKILAPSLDRVLGTMDSLVKLSGQLADKFESLSDPQKNFISSMLITIPAVLGGLGAIASLLGTIAIGTLVWARALPVIEAIGVGFTKAGASIKAFFSPLLFTFDIWYTGVTSLKSALGLLSIQLGEVFLNFGRILGLTSPLGLLLNTLLAYVTNAGRAQELINGAIGNIYNSLVKLFAKLNEFFGEGAGSSILAVLSAISNLLGGILGDVLAGVLNSVSKIIDAIASLFEFVNHPSVENFNKFAKSFADALAGVFIDLGALLAASFLDTLSELGKGKANQPVGTSDFLFAIPSSIGRIMGSGGADQLSALAEKLRASTGIISNDTSKTADNLTKAKTEALEFQKNLDNTLKITNAMSISLEKARASFAKVFADIELANIKFRNAQTQRESQERLDILIQQVGTQAIPSILANQQATTGQGLSEIRQAIKNELPALAAELRAAQADLARAIDAGLQVSTSDKGKAEAFGNAVGNLAKLAESPNVNLQNFAAAFDRMAKAGTGFITTLTAHGPEGQKQLQDISQAQNKVLQAAQGMDKTLGDQIEKENALKNANKEKAEQQEKAARAVTAQADREAAAKPVREELARLEAQRQKDILIPVTNAAEIEAARKREEDYNTKKLELEAKINEITRDSVKLVDKTKDASKAATDKIVADAKLELDILQLKTKANEAFIQSFIDGFGALETFRQKLDEINQSRAAVGLQPNQFLPPTTDIAASLQFQTTPLTNRNRELGGDQTTVSTLDRAVDSIIRSGALDSTLLDGLKKIAIASAAALAAAEPDISKNQADLLREQKRLGLLTPGTQDYKNQEQLIKDILSVQLKLTTQGEIYSNNLKVVNGILTANDKILSESLRTILNQNAAEKATLNFQIQALEQQSQLLQAREANRQARANGPGGLSTTLDLGTADRLAEASLKTQIDLLEKRYQLELNTLELKKLQVKADLEANKISQNEADALLAIYEAQRVILGEIKDQQKDNLNLDKANASATRYKTTLDSLGELFTNNIFTNFAENLRKVAADQADALSTMDASIQLFKDVAAAALVDAFQAIGDSFIKFLETGDSITKSFGAFLGTMLMQLGEALIQMSLAAVAAAFMHGVFKGGLIAGLAEAAAVAPMAAVGVAVGTGLILAGGLMGGQGKYTQKASDKNATNTANSNAGATGPTFDPYKDPKTIYQKAMMAQISIDIRSDSSQIIKTVIKEINSNGRLSTLIGNRKLQFGY
jgi:hypothetical protein